MTKYCTVATYVIQEFKHIFNNFLDSADIKIFGYTCLFAMLLLIGLTLFYTQDYTGIYTAQNIERVKGQEQI